MTRVGRSGPAAAVAAFASAAIALAAAGCGSTTKTVHVSSAPSKATRSRALTSSSATTSSTTETRETTTHAPSTVTTVTQTVHETSSRTSSEPAFVEEEGAAHRGALGSAVALVESEGYVPTSTSEYHGGQTLRVLTAAHGDGGAYAERAFFFVDGRYLGTDASEASASISVISQSDTEVVLGYGLYDSSEAHVGQAEVRFQLNDGKLEALGAIPPVRPSGGGAGRL